MVILYSRPPQPASAGRTTCENNPANKTDLKIHMLVCSISTFSFRTIMRLDPVMMEDGSPRNQDHGHFKLWSRNTCSLQLVHKFRRELGGGPRSRSPHLLTELVCSYLYKCPPSPSLLPTPGLTDLHYQCSCLGWLIDFITAESAASITFNKVNNG